jgi:D-alanine-D-alanine ligase
MLPARALQGIDVVFNVIHGEYGEDGRLHRILDPLRIPYTGATAPASILAFNKHHTNAVVRSLGVKVVERSPHVEDVARQIFRSFPHPAIIKPVMGGSSVGMTLASDYHSLVRGLERAWEYSPKALVEEYIRGKEATVGIIDHFRNEKSYSLLPVEIVPPSGSPFFDYDAKYGGATLERVPGFFAPHEKRELMRAARAVHEALNLNHYSRSDFIVGRRGVYFLEANSAAAVGLTKESLLPKALHAVGVKLSQFLEHVIELARGKKHE